ncbi:MAG: alpha-galactosidase [Microbacterium sp.]|uniref:glycoside hydrolase family 36 protein n=1 Tax=Microbacterium sp. TaxID=51671 RepID=UPI0039E613E8
MTGTTRPQHAGTIEIGGMTVPYLAAGPLRPLGDGTFAAPAGGVALLHPFGDTAFYRHGWNSWSPTGWRRLSEPPLRIENDPRRTLTADDARNDTPFVHSGSAVGAVEGPDGRVLLLGSLGLGTPRVGATETTLWGTVERDDAEWLLAYGDEAEVFAVYAEHVAARLGSRQTRAGRVWCSWYSFYEDISEAALREVVEDLRGLPFDVVQIDDGWERSVGDWEANAKFPSGMRTAADSIRETGAQAGLWLAPLIALPSSGFARERPDLLVRDDDGSPLVSGYNWGSAYFTLDTTRPEVQDHLRALFARVVDWGFSYLKLDFMYAGAVAGVRSTDRHREEVYRDALALIRETVGERTYLLGSGVPMLPSAGLIDGARVGPDVAAFWDNLERPADPSGPGAKNALVASVHRYWLRRLYQTDPDVVYFRRRRSLLDDRQRQALQDLAAVVAFKSTSDRTAWLDPQETDDLREWLERTEEIGRTGRYTFTIDGRPVDLGPLVDGSAVSPSTTVN